MMVVAVKIQSAVTTLLLTEATIGEFLVKLAENM
jgi:hypothetical protein